MPPVRRAFETTTVSTDKTKAEIRAMLLKYGADHFGIMEGHDRCLILFTCHARNVSIEVPMPVKKELSAWATGAARKKQQEAWAQEERRLWRATRMWIFGQLEAVKSGIKTFEAVFLADTLLSSGEKVFDFVEGTAGERVYAARPSLSRADRAALPGGDEALPAARVEEVR